MTEPTVSNPPLDSNRFGMSSTTTPQPLALQSNNSNNIMNNSNNFSHVSNNFIPEQQTNSGNVGILDILSGGGTNQQLKGSSIPFSSNNNNNQTVPNSSSNSIRNL